MILLSIVKPLDNQMLLMVSIAAANSYFSISFYHQMTQTFFLK